MKTLKVKQKNALSEIQDKGRLIVFIIYLMIFILFSLFYLYPIFWCFTNAMKTPFEFFESSVAMPKQFTSSQFISVFSDFQLGTNGFMQMLINSMWQAFGRAFCTITASILVAYPLARYNFPGKNLIFGIIIFRITIPIVGASAAGYKLFRTLNMLDNPGIFWFAWFSSFDMNALILYGYFQGISKTYSEAAYLDGASKMTVLLKVILPQAFPCILALYITQVMVVWNDYTTPMIYLRSYPNLAYGLYEFDELSKFLENGKPVYFAAILLTSIPPILLYVLGQKTMINNMSIGGLKG